MRRKDLAKGRSRILLLPPQSRAMSSWPVDVFICKTPLTTSLPDAMQRPPLVR